MDAIGRQETFCTFSISQWVNSRLRKCAIRYSQCVKTARNQNMKRITFILLILTFICCDCKKSVQRIVDETSVNNSIKIEEPKSVPLVTVKCDTIVKLSDYFNINQIKCQWRFTAQPSNGNDGQGIIELLNDKSKILLRDEDFYNDVCNAIDFNSLTAKNFKDANFDGYKDFILYNNGSGNGGDFYNVYLFDRRKQVFKISELSGGNLTIDTINKIVITSSRMGLSSHESSTYHFKKNGKISYLEISRSELGDEDASIETFKKIVNGKVVKQSIDTIAREEE